MEVTQKKFSFGDPTPEIGSEQVCSVCGKIYKFSEENKYICNSGYTCTWACFLKHVKEQDAAKKAAKEQKAIEQLVETTSVVNSSAILTKKIVSPADVARKLEVKYDDVYNLILSKQVVLEKIGSRYHVSPENELTIRKLLNK